MISNSVWIDRGGYASKKKPDLLLRDLGDRTRNGKIEQGRSPFDKEEFIRADGQTVRLMEPSETSRMGQTNMRSSKMRSP